MPTGKVRFYDAAKGFGFLTRDGGGDVYVNASALPSGTTTLKPGQKVEFGVVEGRRGDQALSLQLVETPKSLSKSTRKSPTSWRSSARTSSRCWTTWAMAIVTAAIPILGPPPRWPRC